MIAIDLGSNTIRAIKYDCNENKKVAEYEKIVKTADNLVKTRKISNETLNRIIEAINELKEKLNAKDEKIKAVATEALRVAKNSNEIIEEIKQKTGIGFEIIDAKKEATYTAIAVEECLKKCGFEYYNHFFLVDIGGGSTEVIVKNKENVLSESFKLGIVTITQKNKTPESIKLAIKKKFSYIKEFLNFSFNVLRKPKVFVASSGTPTTIAALKIGMNYFNYDGSKINGVILNIQDLDYWMDKLLKMDMKTREKLVGVGRGDLIISGIYIFKEFFKITKYKECIVCDEGLREGVAIKECKELI